MKRVLLALLATAVVCTRPSFADRAPVVSHADIRDACHVFSDPHFHYGKGKYSLLTGRALNPGKCLELSQADWKRILECRTSRLNILSKLRSLRTNNISSALLPIFEEYLPNIGSKPGRAGLAASLLKIAGSAGAGACLSLVLDPSTCHAAGVEDPRKTADFCHHKAMSVLAAKLMVVQLQCDARRATIYALSNFFCLATERNRQLCWDIVRSKERAINEAKVQIQNDVGAINAECSITTTCGPAQCLLDAAVGIVNVSISADELCDESGNPIEDTDEDSYEPLEESAETCPDLAIHMENECDEGCSEGASESPGSEDGTNSGSFDQPTTR